MTGMLNNKSRGPFWIPSRTPMQKELYIMEAVALTEHCEAFVYQMGKV